MTGRLTEGFRNVIDLTWVEFTEMERDPEINNFDSIIVSLVRACKKGSLRAIQVALDRIDGKIATEVEFEFPKFYTLYPKATKTIDDPSIIDIQIDENVKKLQTPPKSKIEIAVEEELPTGSIRSVLERMLDAKKLVVETILSSADAIDTGDPPVIKTVEVKTVIVAGLMKMAHEGRMSAVFEILDQIDGKVAETFKILGGDVKMYNYALIAPAGAVKNEDGIYQIVAENTTNSWAARLEQTNGQQKNRR
jgi:hypothetical protein